jgi:FHA domain/Prokaryotic RING finger family 1
MPSLVFEQSGSRHGGTVNGRVLIGRRLSHGVVIGDPTVSRLHAWIDNREGSYVITDAGSRSGTFVNGEAVVRSDLQDGDEIRIGPVKLAWRENDSLPDDIQVLDLSSPAKIESSKSGILFDCACGAPMWVGLEFAGKRGLCKYCGEPIKVPTITQPKKAKVEAKTPEPTTAVNGKKVRPAAPVLRSKCGACHSTIDHGEELTTCSECKTTFHTDCWQENYGCSTYGCSQVNALKPAEVVEAEAKVAQAIQPTSEPDAEMPWELIVLAASVISSLIGTLLYGTLPAAVIPVALIMMFRKKKPNRGILALAMLVSAAGIAIGLVVSNFWWLSSASVAPTGP